MAEDVAPEESKDWAPMVSLPSRLLAQMRLLDPWKNWGFWGGFFLVFVGHLVSLSKVARCQKSQIDSILSFCANTPWGSGLNRSLVSFTEVQQVVKRLRSGLGNCFEWFKGRVRIADSLHILVAAMMFSFRKR